MELGRKVEAAVRREYQVSAIALEIIVGADVELWIRRTCLSIIMLNTESTERRSTDLKIDSGSIDNCWRDEGAGESDELVELHSEKGVLEIEKESEDELSTG